MVKDPITKEAFRADHLIEKFIENKLKDLNLSDDTKIELKNILW